MPVSYDFAGKSVVVTGGSNGIGRAIAERLKGSGVIRAVRSASWTMVTDRLASRARSIKLGPGSGLRASTIRAPILIHLYRSWKAMSRRLGRQCDADRAASDEVLFVFIDQLKATREPVLLTGRRYPLSQSRNLLRVSKLCSRSTNGCGK